MERISLILKRISLFNQLSLQQMQQLVAQLHRIALTEGEMVFELGEEGDAMYIVDDGQIEIFVLSDEGERVVLKEYGMGDSFGEMALLARHNRSAYAQAVAPTRLFRLDRTDFLNFMDSWPEMSLNILDDVSDKLRATTSNVQDLATTLARKNRELQELNELKSSFIGVITHELRTPFANIDFSFQILERYGLDNLSPGQREELEAVAQHIDIAKTMINNLVTFASFVHKQGELHLEEVDFGSLFTEALQIWQPMAESKGVRLESKRFYDELYIQGDAKRLADAVHHLIQNAVKFTPSGGRVVVESLFDEQYLYFFVRDTGVGVPVEKQAHLWEGFTQMADPLRRGLEGLGLGLTLVKYVVNAHGGHVWAESEVGKGSIFGFKLPLTEEEIVDNSLDWT